MAWIARNAGVNQLLHVFDDIPHREINSWCYDDSIEGESFTFFGVELPSDADEKLIGRHITWEDEPIELK